MSGGAVSACVALARRYHHWQLALVLASLLLFCLGSRLLALHESVSPDILTRKIQGNLELSFDRYSRMPAMLLAFAVAALLLPFLSIAAVAMRHRRTVYLYAVLAFVLVGSLLGVAVFLTVQLVAADDNCAQVADCFPCDAHVQPVKCRVLSRFAMKQCFVYSDTLEFVCTQLAAVAYSVVIWLYVTLAVAIVNFVLAVKAVRVELAFTDFYGSSQAQLALDDDNEPEGERIRTLRFGKDANPAMVAATAAATENRPPAAEPAARPSSNDNDDDADDDLSRRLKQALSATSEHER